jgi:hypothetical protein
MGIEFAAFENLGVGPSMDVLEDTLEKAQQHQ